MVLQFALSLLAILFLAWLVGRLRLGGDMRIRDEAHARELAAETIDDFAAREVAIDRAGQAALLRDGTGRVLLLRRHGARFAGRLVGPHCAIERDGDRVTVVSSDRRFGLATLELGPEARDWADGAQRTSPARADARHA